MTALDHLSDQPSPDDLGDPEAIGPAPHPGRLVARWIPDPQHPGRLISAWVASPATTSPADADT